MLVKHLVCDPFFICESDPRAPTLELSITSAKLFAYISFITFLLLFCSEFSSVLTKTMDKQKPEYESKLTAGGCDGDK